MKLSKTTFGYSALVLLGVIALATLCFTEPITQDSAYHNFIDNRCMFSIPNFWNVISNVPFIIIGLFGMYKLIFTRRLQLRNEMKTIYLVYFCATLLIGIGSSYYHWHPTNNSLVWDRLPMTIAFMSLFSIIIGEFISVEKGRKLFIPLVLTGILSILYWVVTAWYSAGDLRWYALIQFYPMLAIPIILLCFKSSFTNAKAYWLLLVAYLFAKAFEHFDVEVYHTLHYISGHSLKHFLAAFGLYSLLFAYEKRKPTNKEIPIRVVKFPNINISK